MELTARDNRLRLDALRASESRLQSSMAGVSVKAGRAEREKRRRRVKQSGRRAELHTASRRAAKLT